MVSPEIVRCVHANAGDSLAANAERAISERILTKEACIRSNENKLRHCSRPVGLTRSRSQQRAAGVNDPGYRTQPRRAAGVNDPGYRVALFQDRLSARDVNFGKAVGFGLHAFVR